MERLLRTFKNIYFYVNTVKYLACVDVFHNGNTFGLYRSTLKTNVAFIKETILGQVIKGHSKRHNSKSAIGTYTFQKFNKKKYKTFSYGHPFNLRIQ